MPAVAPGAGPEAGASPIEESLEGMMSRLDVILAADRLTDRTLVELMAIYNNVAYVFLYLEAVDDDENFTRLLPWRRAFYQDDDRTARIVRRLRQLRCADARLDAVREEYLAELTAGERRDPAEDARLDDLLDEAKAVLAGVRDARREILRRVGARDAEADPAAVYYTVLGSMESTATRDKLARVWAAARDARQPALLAALDAMVTVRRRRSARAGHPNVAAGTLARCRATEADIAAFVTSCLETALAAHAEVESEIAAVTGATGRPMDHLGFAMRTVFGAGRAPAFRVGECLDFLFAVTRAVFGLTLTRQPSGHPQVIKVAVRDADDEIGDILFDLWDTDRGTPGPNHTLGLRNRTDWSGLVQRPVAYVSCRFRPDTEGTGHITFQNVHGMFHEFGHALNHLLLRTGVPFRSGLESLPPERLECLSMWFEKWACHPEFARRLTLGPAGEEQWARCVRIKMFEQRAGLLEQAVTAALDLEVHRSGTGGLRDAFDRLDGRYGIGRHYQLGDVAAYFTWPMYVANPGANFSYLWGAADSAGRFAAFRELSLADITGRPEPRGLLAPCFDPDAPAEVPDGSAVFRLYGSSALTG
ncbi:M3 family metallopeptidase [Streptomyces arenae]|uniref:M3 family metallopeptidase n=1 Tax=Streptomyces arenae TaxID=29301 RepID=UPI002659A652|nr:M3 family metallopeptidase [Streptomyces arenae]MCG7203594.1 M3 family metallopeptidase [Streptomyces arenae]